MPDQEIKGLDPVSTRLLGIDMELMILYLGNDTLLDVYHVLNDEGPWNAADRKRDALGVLGASNDLDLCALYEALKYGSYRLISRSVVFKGFRMTELHLHTC